MDIIVTARRTAEKLQDVPVAVTLVSQASIDAKGVFDPIDLADMTPGLSIAPSVVDRNNLVYTIRGQSFVFGSVFPAVITYLDEVPNQYLTQGAFFDLENVQILRGPQGVNFGRVTDGGNVMLSSKKPTNEFGGYVGVKLGDYSLRTVNGAINIPIVKDKVLFRAAFETTRRNGFTTNLANGRKLDDAHYDAFRGSLTLRPVDTVENTTVVSYVKTDTNGTGVILDGINVPAFASTAANIFTGLGFVTPGYGIDPRGNVVPFVANTGLLPFTQANYIASHVAQLAAQNARSNREVDLDDPLFSRRKHLYISNKTTIDLSDSIQLTNIIGFNHEIVDDASDYTPANGGYIKTCHSACGGGVYQDVKHLSEELRLSGTSFDDRLTWSLGGYLDRQKPGGAKTNNRFFGGILHQTTLNERETRSRALYGSLEYDVTSNFSLNGGLRFTHDTIDQRSGNFSTFLESPAARTALANFLTGFVGFTPAQAAGVVNSTFTELPVSCDQTPYAVGGVFSGFAPVGQTCTQYNKSFKTWTFTAGATYKTDAGQLFYAKYSKGYRPGGVNETPPPGLTPEFEPETDFSAEVGFKADWNIGGAFLRTNVTGFWDSYKDIQKLVVTPASNNSVTSVIRNVDDARIRGIEAEATLVPTEGLTFSGTFAYIDAHYKGTGPGVDLSACNPNATAVLGFCPANMFGQTPKFSYSLNADFVLPFPPEYGAIHVGGAMAGRSRMAVTDTSVMNPLSVVRALTTFDLNVNWRNVMEQPVDVGFFVTNLTNEEYLIGSNDLSQASSAGTRGFMYAAPRMWGFSMKYHFGGDAK
ncbi:MAG: TonB-dependent receptor [Novosphingobium sp.]